MGITKYFDKNPITLSQKKHKKTTLLLGLFKLMNETQLILVNPTLLPHEL